MTTSPGISAVSCVSGPAPLILLPVSGLTIPPPDFAGAFNDGKSILVRVSRIDPGLDSSFACSCGVASSKPLSLSCCSVAVLLLPTSIADAIPIPAAAAMMGLERSAPPRENNVLANALINPPIGVSSINAAPERAGQKSDKNFLIASTFPAFSGSPNHLNALLIPDARNV